jgi:ribosomal protein S18 acetylase RimI-like enzyme
MPITLRPATAEDEAFLYELYASTRAAEVAAWGWTPAQAQQFLQMQFRAQRGYAAYPGATEQIIEWEGQSVGHWMVGRSADEIRLIDIALLPEYQRRGFGTSLLKDLQRTARDERKPIRLHVAYGNPARLWYERHGFKLLAERGAHELMEWHDDLKSGHI